MSKYIKLSPAQKDEIRRLTQLANRRIKNAEKAYAKEGLHRVPKDIAGHVQVREKWNTKNTPLSRSVKFESRSDYMKQLKFLQSFERTRQGIKEYSEVQREKTLEAMKTSLDGEIPEGVIKKINKMNAPQLSKFWKAFSDKSSRLGMQYSSESAITSAMSEFFAEDMQGLASTMPKRR